LIWLKFFYYLRLFKPVSFLIRIIIEIVKDVIAFVMIFFFGVLTFANFFFITNLGSKEKVLGDWNSSYGGAIIYTYMQVMGEYDYSNYQNSEFYLLFWTILLFLTFFLTIVMLNMLIAIVNDTFERVQEVAKEA